MTAVLPPTVEAPAHHHPSHRGLLCRPTPSSARAHLDAIIVPTIRHASVLEDAFQLGRAMRVPVVVLSSKRWSSVHAVRALALRTRTHVIAVDVNRPTKLPRFKTSELRNQHRFSDLSLKRNIGLALARMLNWQGILLLDDDITRLDPEQVLTAAAHLAEYRMVTLENVGFEDNSVVCHALRRVERSIGLVQDTFVGGGAMVVAPRRVDSFFPDVYNEDWFFMLGILEQESPARRVAAAGTMAQRPYDPYADPERARYEEFGDCLGEGLFALLDENLPLGFALREEYWKNFLADRESLLDRIQAATMETLPLTMERENIAASIKVARGKLRSITAETCVIYLEAWKQDRVTWRRFLAKLDHHRTAADALARLGLQAWEE